VRLAGALELALLWTRAFRWAEQRNTRPAPALAFNDGALRWYGLPLLRDLATRAVRLIGCASGGSPKRVSQDCASQDCALAWACCARARMSLNFPDTASGLGICWTVRT
jgi:hypothetical protein